jgi:hypothetical protein
MLTIEKKSLKVGKYVDANHVDTLTRNYKQERWVYNSERIGKEDSLSVWYSIEELEEFMNKAKMHGGDGIRLFFGAYSQDFAPKPGYEDRQTIVLVATKQKETLNGVVNKSLHIATENGNGTTVLAYNVGDMCPPNCGKRSGDGDDWGGIGTTTLIDRGDKGITVI